MFIRFKVLALPSVSFQEQNHQLQSPLERFLEVLEKPNHCYTLPLFLVLDRLDHVAASKLEAVQEAHKHRVEEFPYLPKEYLKFFKRKEHREADFTISNLTDASFNSLLFIHFTDNTSHVIGLIKDTEPNSNLYTFFDQNLQAEKQRLQSLKGEEPRLLLDYYELNNLKRTLSEFIERFAQQGLTVESMERVFYTKKSGKR